MLDFKDYLKDALRDEKFRKVYESFDDEYKEIEDSIRRELYEEKHRSSPEVYKRELNVIGNLLKEASKNEV